MAKKRSPAFAHFLDRMILKMPVIGQIMHNSAIARFARTLAVTFKAGVPLVEALDTRRRRHRQHRVRTRPCTASATTSSVGYQVNMAMKQVNLFPHMVVQMMAIGEEAGALDTMLFKVAEFYEQEVNNAVDALASLLEPMIMVIIGVIVGGMVDRHVPADLQAGRGRSDARTRTEWHSWTRTPPSAIRWRRASGCWSAASSTS